MEESTESGEESPGQIRGPDVKRRFAVFIDYLNLRKSIRTPNDLDLDTFIDSIIAKGRLQWMYVFIPEHVLGSVPMRTLVSRYQAWPVVCPQDMDTSRILKDKDTVDFQMNRLIQSIVEHTDITDIIIVSGDADFYPVARWTHQQGIRVHIISGKPALSKMFSEDDKISVTTI